MRDLISDRDATERQQRVRNNLLVVVRPSRQVPLYLNAPSVQSNGTGVFRLADVLPIA
jgi:hypothetical protein